jgi:DNA-binding CsgD family transcriptional regulator
MTVDSLKNMWKARDELSPRNFRLKSLPLALVLLLSMIIGDLRYIDQELFIFGMDSNVLIQIAFGLGFLPIFFTQERHIAGLLRISVLAQAALLAAQFFIATDIHRFYSLFAFHFANGASTACGLYLFAFALNNVERLFTMAATQTFFASLYLLTLNAKVTVFLLGPGSALIMLALAAIPFFISKPLSSESAYASEPAHAHVPRARESGITAIIALGVIYHIITLMTLYIEHQEQTVSAVLYAFGGITSIAAIIAVMLIFNYSALHLWSLCLACTVLGIGALYYTNAIAIYGGSFFYGIGEGLGFMLIYYLQGGALKRSGSFRLLRLCCLFICVNYTVVNYVFFTFYDKLDAPNLSLAFPAVLVLEIVCLLIAPLLHDKLFRTDWTDGYHMADMPLYSEALKQAGQAADIERDLGLTPRETEIFIMLLTDAPYKQIAYTLRLNLNTVKWHSKNLYRKLNIQSRPELFAQYGDRKHPTG